MSRSREALLSSLLALSSQASGADLNSLKAASVGRSLADHGGDVLLLGVAEIQGSRGPLSLRFDRGGRFLRRVESDLGFADAFDGEHGWRTDWSGMPITSDLATLQQSQLENWLITGAWLSNPSLVTVGDAISGSEDEEIRLTVSTSEGAQDVELTVDRSTGLPKTLRSQTLSGEIEISFGEYFESRGMKFPGRVTRSAAGHIESVFEFRTVEWSSEPASGSEVYSQRPDRPRDAEFSETSGEVPIRFAATGHILVQPSVDGEPMDWFIFDTGAAHSSLAKGSRVEASLPQVGSVIIATILGVEVSPVRRAQRLTLGPLDQIEPRFPAMDMSPLEPYLGEPIGGIIGFDVLSRSIVEVDIEGAQMTIHDPDHHTLTDGEWLPLRFQDNHPIVSASFPGGQGLFRLDLGASGGPHGNVVFNQPTVEALDLLPDPSAAEEIQMGTITGAVGTVDWFELSGERFESPEVVFGTDDQGIFSDTHTMGNIGVDILRRFRIVFDYPRERIALIPNSR